MVTLRGFLRRESRGTRPPPPHPDANICKFAVLPLFGTWGCPAGCALSRTCYAAVGPCEFHLVEAFTGPPVHDTPSGGTWQRGLLERRSSSQGAQQRF